MNFLRAAWRLLRVVVHVAGGLWTVYARFSALSELQRHERIVAWARRLLELFAVRLEVRGDAAISGPLLLVANHISWLDITVIHASRFCRFVSKADVRHWPVVGRLASAAGTVFIERESRRDAMRVVHRMTQSLNAGEVLAVFPEGTTSDGTGLLPFHANLLQAAITAQAPVQPVALQFLDAATGQTSLAACYVGDDHLLGSLWRTLRTPGLKVVVTFGAVQTANGRDRRAWAADLREAVAALRAG